MAQSVAAINNGSTPKLEEIVYRSTDVDCRNSTTGGIDSVTMHCLARSKLLCWNITSSFCECGTFLRAPDGVFNIFNEYLKKIF